MNNNGKELLQIGTLTCTTSCLVYKNLGKVNDVGNYVATTSGKCWVGKSFVGSFLHSLELHAYAREQFKSLITCIELEP
jgi:hypothetical protein